LLVAGLFWEKSTAGWWLISQANRLPVLRSCSVLTVAASSSTLLFPRASTPPSASPCSPACFAPLLDVYRVIILQSKSNSKRLAKMTWLAKFWKKSQKHSSNRLAIYPTSYPN
jgi:hypothetical protein